MLSTLPVLVIVLVIGTLVVTRSQRHDEVYGSGTPEPALPGPRARIDRRVVSALARREAWRLTRHPAVVVGVVLSVAALAVVNEGAVWVTGQGAAAAGITAFPLAGLTLVANNLATLRVRRMGAEGIVDTTPATAASRTAAHLLASLGPALLMAVVLGGWNLYMHASGSAVGVMPPIADLALPLVLVVAAGCVGVLLAVVAPTPVLAVPAVILLGFAEMATQVPAPEYRDVRRLGWTVIYSADVPLELLDRRPGLHLAYVVALTLAVATVALARLVPPRARSATVVPAVALVLVTAVAVTRPISDQSARRLASWANEGDSRLRCRTVADATVCAYPEYDFRDDWEPVLERMAAAAPRGLNGVRVSQRFARQSLMRVAPAVTRHFAAGIPRGPEEPWPYDDAVHPDIRWDARGGTDHLLAIDVAAATVGLPPNERSDGICSSADQARAVAALWLAAHGSPGAHSAVEGMTAPLEDFADDEVAMSFALFPVVGVETWRATYNPSLRWSRRDADYALALLARDDREIRNVLAANWETILRPSTTSDQLAAWAGLDPRPSLDEMAAGLGTTVARAERIAARPIHREFLPDLPPVRGQCT